MREVNTTMGKMRTGLDLSLMDKYVPGALQQGAVKILNSGIVMQELGKAEGWAVYLSRDKSRMAIVQDKEGWKPECRGRNREEKCFLSCVEVVSVLQEGGVEVPQKATATWDEDAGLWEVRLKKAGA
jgi:hypothetical protein